MTADIKAAEFDFEPIFEAYQDIDVFSELIQKCSLYCIASLIRNEDPNYDEIGKIMFFNMILALHYPEPKEGQFYEDFEDELEEIYGHLVPVYLEIGGLKYAEQAVKVIGYVANNGGFSDVQD